MRNNKIKDVCIKCKAKCCKLAGVFLTRTEKEQIEKADYKNFCDKDGRFFEMKHSKGVCIFLKNNLCSIYDIRPVMCRSFPIYPVKEKFRTKYILISCPLSRYLDKNNISKLKKHARKIPNKYATLDIFEYSSKIQKRYKDLGWPIN